MEFEFDLQLFGGGGKSGGSTSGTSSYTPSAEEKQLMGYAVNNAAGAQKSIDSMQDTFTQGVTSQAYKDLGANASSQIASGQDTISGLTQGNLPSEYTQNMTDSIKTTVNNTVGSAINKNANNGVLNSSVQNKNNYDIQRNAADITAQNFNNNVNTVANLAGSQISNATAGYAPYSAQQQLLANQQNAFVTSPLGAMKNTGSTSTSNNQTQGIGTTLGQMAAIGSFFI